MRSEDSQAWSKCTERAVRTPHVPGHHHVVLEIGQVRRSRSLQALCTKVTITHTAGGVSGVSTHPWNFKCGGFPQWFKQW